MSLDVMRFLILYDRLEKTIYKTFPINIYPDKIFL